MRILVTGGSGFIGTNLIEEAESMGYEILNIDIAPPLESTQTKYWACADILDLSRVRSLFTGFRPDHVVHLAARTDTQTGDPLEKYAVNTVGTASVLEAVRSQSESISGVVVASTQFVCRPGFQPSHADDYQPHTVYGQSKVIAERLTRGADLSCAWTIVRPTTVWGPWCLRHRDGFFRALRGGWYLHPGSKPCIRSYGYVGNVVDQIVKILKASPSSVRGRTLYVGDRPVVLLDWVQGFSMALTGKQVRVVPRPVMRLAALVGDGISRFRGRDIAITSQRFRSMTEDYPVDMEPTFKLIGQPRHSIEDGIKATVRWLKLYGRFP